MRTTRAAAASMTIALLLSGGWLACGGDDSTPETGGDAGADATTDRGGGNDTGGGTDTSLQNDTSSGNDTGTETDTGTNTEAGADGGADAPQDVALIPDSSQTVTDAGPGGDGANVSCGSASCALPAQTCCIYDKDASFNVACSTGASCPVVYSNPDAGDGGDAGTASTAVALQCEIRENCPANNVCCIVKDVSGSISSHCSVTCSGGAKNAELCSSTAGDAGCGDAGACSSTNIGTWGLPNGFATCGGRSAL